MVDPVDRILSGNHQCQSEVKQKGDCFMWERLSSQIESDKSRYVMMWEISGKNMVLRMSLADSVWWLHNTHETKYIFRLSLSVVRDLLAFYVAQIPLEKIVKIFLLNSFD